jgi:peptidoglycan/xylan/chitin deacetylase (PgdA/CDA1 family)
MATRPTPSCVPAAVPARTGTPFDFSHYQHERYRGTPRRGPVLNAYYTLKPLIPRSLQLALRRRYATRQAKRVFPAWPIEPVLVNAVHDELRARIEADAADRVPIVGFWPAGYLSASILTHDVESEAGFSNIARLVELEQRHGFTSSWNFVAEDYSVPTAIFDQLRAAGCEIGLHGIRHDGKLFQSRARFEAELPKIHHYLEAWEAVGFRSPATHRRAEWMHELACLYDSSYPDTDPFEPQPGGCCSILPFMFGELVELPITLAQDHTLWEILENHTIDVWRDKAAWIIDNHGLVSINTHPDYFVSEERFALYDEFVAFLAARSGCWRALPADVASWWRLREHLCCEELDGGDARVVGEGAERAAIWWAQTCRDGVVLGP